MRNHGWLVLAAGLAACQSSRDRGESSSAASTITLFSDAFERTTAIDGGLGASWALASGFWFTHGQAETDSDGGNLAGENQASCADCTAQASVLGFGVTAIGVYLRSPSASATGDRYEGILAANGEVQIRRVRGGVTTVLAHVASGVDLSSFSTVSLEASGAGPVQLRASVNGVVLAQASDSGTQVIAAAGFAGMVSSSAGTLFDNFVLTAPAPVTDGGVADLAQPADLSMPRDLATPRDLAQPRDLSVPPDLAQPRDLSVPPDLSMPPPADLGVPPGPLFSDAFDRTVATDTGLGPNWTLDSGFWFTHNVAETDSDSGNLATENQVKCGDCRVDVKVLGFGVPAIGPYLRAPAPTNANDRYDAVLTTSGNVQIRRVRSGTATVLAQAASKLPALDQWSTISLEARGTSPVQLTAYVNGTSVVTASDSTAQAIVAAGYAGMVSSSAGTDFDDFLLSGSSTNPPPPDMAVPPPDMTAPPPDLSTRPPDLSTGGPNPIVVENARAGTGDWLLGNSSTNHEIEGYSSVTSVPRGGTISFYVSCQEPSYTIQIFRLGWYGGAGGRAMTSAVTRTTVAQPACPMNATTGMVECNWTQPYVLSVPASADPSDWASGLYVAKITSSATSHDMLIRFVVRDDTRHATYLAQSSATTHEAYNAWGGKSLYDFNSTGGRASQVSFNRPLDNPNIDGFEVPMVRFLEREGYDVSYSSNLDTHENGAAIRQHKAFLSVGHDEYWSSQMRDNVEGARDAGVHLGFFAANVSYWQVRFAPSPVSGAADRTMICYKDASTDPVAQTNPSQTTVLFRDPPVNRSEDHMIGVMYEYDPVDADLVVVNTSHWVFAGTGLHDGDHLHRLLGYEVDGVFNTSLHPGLVVLGNSPYSGGTMNSNMAIYTAPSGAVVFATGTIWWSFGLDDITETDRLSPAVQQITRNVLSRFAQ
jgi:hypothetical protein